jgi:hypothetical protein
MLLIVSYRPLGLELRNAKAGPRGRKPADAIDGGRVVVARIHHDNQTETRRQASLNSERLDLQFAIVAKVLHLADSLNADKQDDESATDWLRRSWHHVRPHVESIADMVGELRRLDLGRGAA